jgi:hypothetical protein
MAGFCMSSPILPSDQEGAKHLQRRWTAPTMVLTEGSGVNLQRGGIWLGQCTQAMDEGRFSHRIWEEGIG